LFKHLSWTILYILCCFWAQAGKMQIIIDELPDQNLLNTAEWRFIVPQLYKRYPNDDMQINVSVSSPPVIQVGYQDIGATLSVDITIDVLEGGEAIPVACISVVGLLKSMSEN
jgi:hypothetical protein